MTEGREQLESLEHQLTGSVTKELVVDAESESQVSPVIIAAIDKSLLGNAIVKVSVGRSCQIRKSTQ